MQCHLLAQHIHSLNIPPEHVYEIVRICDDEFKTWFNENAPPNLHTLLLFHPRQVQSNTTPAHTTPIVSSTPASSQQMDQGRQGPEISPLHVTPPTSLFNEVNDFQKDIKGNITLYPRFKDYWQYDSWYCKTQAIASIYGTETVFDPHYSPKKLLKLNNG